MIFICSQRYDYHYQIKEFRESIDTRLNKYFFSLNINLVCVSMHSEGKYLKYLLERIKPDGIILSGGNNLNSNSKRDKLEKNLIKYAIKNNLPIIGICRGMQLIGSYFGVGLKKVNNHVAKKHKIYLKKNLLKKIKKESFYVNSFHNYALKECPKDFQILAMSKDKIIEAIVHNKYPIIGIMWHPERYNLIREIDSLIIKSVL